MPSLSRSLNPSPSRQARTCTSFRSKGSMTIVAPAELARRPQWVAWRLVPREGEPKPTKVPYDARTGRHASTTDPSTWATFEEAAAFCAHHEWASGVGYVLS